MRTKVGKALAFFACLLTAAVVFAGDSIELPRILSFGTSLDGVDTTAIHVDESNEISGIPLKAVAANDILVIESTDDGNSKRRVTAQGIADLGGGGGGVPPDEFRVAGTTIAALQTAIDLAEANGGGTVTFCGDLTGEGDFDGLNKLVFDQPNVTVKGCSQKSARILMTTDSDTGATEVSTTFISILGDAGNITIRDLTIEHVDTAAVPFTVRFSQIIELVGGPSGDSTRSFSGFHFENVTLKTTNDASTVGSPAIMLVRAGERNAFLGFGHQVHDLTMRNVDFLMDGGAMGEWGWCDECILENPKVRTKPGTDLYGRVFQFEVGQGFEIIDMDWRCDRDPIGDTQCLQLGRSAVTRPPTNSRLTTLFSGAHIHGGRMFFPTPSGEAALGIKTFAQDFKIEDVSFDCGPSQGYFELTAISDVTDELTIPNHGFRSGTFAEFEDVSTTPSISAPETFEVVVVDANTISLKQGGSAFDITAVSDGVGRAYQRSGGECSAIYLAEDANGTSFNGLITGNHFSNFVETTNNTGCPIRISANSFDNSIQTNYLILVDEDGQDELQNDGICFNSSAPLSKNPIMGNFVRGSLLGFTSIASVATVELPTSRPVVEITGTTNITSVRAMASGYCVTLKFAGVLTFTQGTNLVIAGDFVTTSNDTISMCMGNLGGWFETSRSVN